MTWIFVVVVVAKQLYSNKKEKKVAKKKEEKPKCLGLVKRYNFLHSLNCVSKQRI